MSKLIGPLFSLSAWKSLGKTIVYQRRGSGHAAYKYGTPYDTKTPSQLAMRVYMGQARRSWRQLPVEYQKAWNNFIIAK